MYGGLFIISKIFNRLRSILFQEWCFFSLYIEGRKIRSLQTSLALDGLPDNDFLKMVYRDILGRDIDSNRLKLYKLMFKRGIERETVLRSLLKSDEFQDKWLHGLSKRLEDYSWDYQFQSIIKIRMDLNISSEDFTDSVYQLLMDGGIRQDVLEQYVNLLEQGVISRKEIVGKIATSEEFISKIIKPYNAKKIQDISDKNFLKAAYRGLLNRVIDEDGMAIYSERLRQGASHHEVLCSIAGSKEFLDRLLEFIHETFVSLTECVEIIHRQIFGKGIEKDKLDYYKSKVGEGATLRAISAEMVSPEKVLETFVSEEESVYIRDIYGDEAVGSAFQGIMQRKASLSELDFYNQRLKNGKTRMANIVHIFNKWEFLRLLEIKKTYHKWSKFYDTLTDKDRESIREHIKKIRYQPLISVLMPVYNTPEKFLRSAIESVWRQLYDNWELCIADDASSLPHVRKILEEYREKDSRIKVVFRDVNGHISKTSNSALERATGEFTALLDHDDELTEHALYMMAEELKNHPETDIIYSDEDKIDIDGRATDQVYFKPDWSPDLLYSQNFVSHLGVYRTSILKKSGGFRQGYEGSQDHDLLLRVIEQIPHDRIRHIPHVLYHWRVTPGSVALDVGEKEYAIEAARGAIQSHFDRKGVLVHVQAGKYSYEHRAVYLPADPPPKVSLIIYASDSIGSFKEHIEEIREKTDYPRLEIIVAEKKEKLSVAINRAVSKATGEIVGLINENIIFFDSGWLKEMVSHALQPETGAVGGWIFNPGGTIRHAGIILGMDSVGKCVHKNLPRDYFSRNPGLRATIRNFSAVSGEFMVLRKEVFTGAGGLDENLKASFLDIDLCLRIREKGFYIVFTPFAECCFLGEDTGVRLEGGEYEEDYREDLHYLRSQWGDALVNDPYYNPNLSLYSEISGMAFPPHVKKPWK